MIRRLFRIGNSIVLALPKKILAQLEIKAGEQVRVELDQRHRRVIVTPVERPLVVPGIDEDFARKVDEFIGQYREALEELAR